MWEDESYIYKNVLYKKEEFYVLLLYKIDS